MSERFLILHEGRKSETNYISSLNRFLRDSPQADPAEPISFVSLITGKEENKKDRNGSGCYTQVAKAYQTDRANNRNARIYIWVDFDIYARNDNGNLDLYKQKGKSIPDFMFNHHNFEDFLAMHYPLEGEFGEWTTRCRNNGHLNCPLHSDSYLPEYTAVFPGYTKNEMPFDIEPHHLLTLFENNRHLEHGLHSDFATFLENKIPSRFLTEA